MSMLREAEEVEEDDIEKQLSSAEFQITKEIIALQPQPQSQSRITPPQAQRKHLKGTFRYSI